MSAHRVVFLPGDGIGPEVAHAARRVLEAAGMEIDWIDMDLGLCAFEKCGDALPADTLAAIKGTGVALKGPTTTPIGTGHVSANVRLRKELELFANVRPVKTVPGLETSHGPVDMVIIRENTESLYAGLENEVAPGVVTSIKVITDRACKRISKFAFDYAKRWDRKEVTAVHKANIMKFTDGLFLAVAEEVSKRYPDIEFEERIVDNMCMQLVQKPELYDVLVLPNLYGDILSDLGAGLVGGLGVAPGANIGTKAALFEPTHGSAPKYAGQNKVNPIAMMLSGVMMLRHLKEHDAADRMEGAIADVIREGKSVTYDMKEDRNDPSAVGTSHVADAIIEKLQVTA